MQPEASVVIASAGNRRSWLLRCVESVKNQSAVTSEIIIVSLRAIPELQADPSVSFIHEPRRGASLARNVGWMRSRSAIVAFIDDDCVADQRWIASILDRFSQRGSVLAGVTGRVLPLRPGVYTVGPDSFEEAHTFGPPPGSDPPWKVGGGLNMAFRTEILRATGGFDTNLGPGSALKAAEDLDFFHRVIATGGQIDYDPSVLVFHEPLERFREVVSKRFGFRVGLGALFAKHRQEDPIRGAFWPFVRSEVRNALTAILRRDVPSALVCMAGIPGLMMGRAIAGVFLRVPSPASPGRAG